MAGPRPDEPRLDSYVHLDSPRAAVLLLHGGQQTNTEPVQDKHASWWRMALLARSLRRFARRQGFELDLLQYRLRGWNGPTDPSPVGDARWAVERIRERHPGVPIVLVGHSMGGRTACRIADEPGVLGVVGLAPWLPEGEPVSSMTGSSLHVLHGTADRWTSARFSKDFVDRSAPIARSVSWQSLPGAGHFMFRQVSAWREFVESSIEQIVEEGT